VLVRVLGPIDVVVEGHVRAVDSARLREVLAVVTVRQGRVVAVDALVAALWGDGPPPSAHHTLRGLVSRLRRLLGDGVIETRAPGYLLSAGRAGVDSEEFERRVAQARACTSAGEHGAALRAFDAALGLWRGPAYGELADRPFAQAAAVRLEELRAAAAEDRMDLRLASCPSSDLVGDLEAAADEEPYRERRQGQLMTALARSGRPVEAMRSYERFRRRLGDEVGVTPSRSLQQLNDDILRQAPGTAWEHGRVDASADPPSRPDRLPRPVTSFVGRTEAVAEVVAAIHPRRVVTVCGPGGVGKTRLAIAAARAADAANRPGDGLWWCDLSAVTGERDEDGGDRVAAAVAAALGASPEPREPIAERVVRFLAGKQLILVVDNCEQVVGRVAALVAAILQRTPGVSVLATSREPLAIDGEHVLDLEPLGAGEAVELFVARAAAIRRGFQLTPDTAATVTEICRRLDGVPLAVELAAGRLRSLGVADVARLLDDRFRILVSARRDAPDRHRTLRAAIDTSFVALTAQEQTAFARLAVFPATFAIDAAEAVCGTEGAGTDVIELLSNLVVRSLVVAEPDDGGAIRYRLLETLRTYAEDRLAEAGDDATPAAQRRHAEHYADRVAQAAAGIAGPDESRWLAWLSTEMPNLRAAVHRAIAWGDVDLAARLFTLFHPWMWCGTTSTSEIGRWATLLARLPAVEQHPTYPVMCEWGFRGATSGGDPVRVHEWAQRANAPTFTPTAITLGCLAYATLPRDPAQAAAMFLRANELARVGGDHLTEAAHLTMMINDERSFSSAPSPEVVAGSRRCLAAARASGSPMAIAWGLFNVATTLAHADRGAAMAAIDELPSVVARCFAPDTTLRIGAEYAAGIVQLHDGDLAGLKPLRAEIARKLADGYRNILTVHLLRLAQALVHLDLCPADAATLIAGVRAQRLYFTTAAAADADRLRTHMGDGVYVEAVRRGESLTLEELGARALATIDRLLASAP
jgi:predicted ATPase/DNA-binding SARP family transcriptional activator